MRRIYDAWKIIFGTVRDSYSMKMSNWSVNTEVTGVSTINFKDCTSMSTSLLCSKAYQISNAKAHVFSDSVLCVGTLGDDPIATWRSKIMVLGKQSRQGCESNRWHADGVRVENIPMNHDVGPPREDLKSNEGPAVWTWAPHSQDHPRVNVQRHWIGSRRKQRKMWIQFTDSCELCSQIPSRSLFYLGVWIWKEMVRNLHWRTDGYWDRTAQNKMPNFPGSGHPIFRVSSAFERGELRIKGGRKSQYTWMVFMKTSSCFSAQWFLRISSLASEQSQIYATIYPKISGLWGNVQHLIVWKRWKFLPTSQLQRILPLHSSGKLCARIRAEIWTIVRVPEKTKLCSDAGLKLVETGQYFHTIDTEGGRQMQHLYREFTVPRNEKGLV